MMPSGSLHKTRRDPSRGDGAGTRTPHSWGLGDAPRVNKLSKTGADVARKIAVAVPTPRETPVRLPQQAPESVQYRRL